MSAHHRGRERQDGRPEPGHAAAAAAVQEARRRSARSAARREASPSLRARPAKAADAAASRFTDLTAKMAKIDVVNARCAADLDKQSAEELAEEAKMLDAADAAVAAKRARQRAVGQGQAGRRRRRRTRQGAQGRDRRRERTPRRWSNRPRPISPPPTLSRRARTSPVSVFISAKTGRLVAKLGFAQVLDVPVTIAEPGRPLGTHVLTATAFTDGEKALRWNSVTLKRPRQRRRSTRAARSAATTTRRRSPPPATMPTPPARWSASRSRRRPPSCSPS